jgi:hypothetical protein
MHNQYLFRRKVLKIFGGAFHIYDRDGNVVLFSEQKAFKLKEDFRIYSDDTKGEEMLAIKTPQILDIGATYYVRDSTTGEEVGALRRRGIKSIFKDEWIILDRNGSEAGRLKEASSLGAFLSRLLKLIPQKYIIFTEDELRPLAMIKQHFNPFVLKYTWTILEPYPAIDRRLLIAAGILLCGIEMRQGD